MAGPYKIASFAEHVVDPIDVLICSASYEDRCRSIPECISPDLVKQVLVCENEDLLTYVGKNGQLLKDRFGDKAVGVPLNTNDPLKVADNLEYALAKVITAEPQRLLVDTTTFTREALLILLNLIHCNIRANNTAYFTYATAKEYSIGQKPEDKWLSKGISQIRSVLGYAGSLLPSRKLHLLVLCGFEHERAAKLIDTFEPAVTSLGFGQEEQSISHENYEINVAFHKRLCDLYQNIESFCFSLTDPLQTKNEIQKVISSKPDYNIVIAALNNKISAIGAALAAFENSEIQLCYAQANHYNYESYSIPGDEFYIFEIPEFLRLESPAAQAN